MQLLNKFKSFIYYQYMNYSIRKKIVLLNYGIIILISLLIGTYSYIVYSNKLIDDISTINLRDTKQIKNTIGMIQKDITELSTFICLNDTIQKVLKLKTSKLLSRDINKTKTLLSNNLVSKEAISFISIYGNNGFQYYVSSDASTGISNLNIIKKTKIYYEAVNLKGHPLWNPIPDNNIFIIDNKQAKVAMFRAILNLDTYNVQGFMMIAINLSTIYNIYNENLNIPGSSFLIIDENNQIISPKNNKQAQEILTNLKGHLNGSENSKLIKINNKEMLLTYSTIDESNWKVLYLVPRYQILKPVRTILYTTIVVLLLCLIIGFILSMWTSKVVTNPITKLLSSMEKVKQGHFKEKVNFIYQDEIGQLGIQYNEMIDELNNLVNRVFKLQLQEKEAELKALQAQINPHFLYNTLDTIFWKAEKSNQKEISEMIYALANLFRLTLNRGENFTSVKNEKKLIEYYAILQKKRYKDKMDYQINFCEDILNYSIPKLILQPFVENAIIHGIEETDRKTLIKVTGTRINNYIKFSIQDNGIGIKPDILNDINNISQRNDSKVHGYAIQNIQERLSLYYEGNYKLNISSESGNGTLVEIVIPIKL